MVGQPRIGGMRLDRITVLRSGGRTVGCRFYGLQHPTADCSATCLAGEKLPGPHQPAIEIESVRYPSDLAAHNALVLNSRKGANVQQAAILGQAPGLCYQLDFYPKDHGTDWTCAYNKGRRLVTVRTVVTSPAFTVIRLTREVGRKL